MKCLCTRWFASFVARSCCRAYRACTDRSIHHIAVSRYRTCNNTWCHAFRVYRGMTQARVQCYSLALVFYLWSKPHYRNSTFQEVGRGAPNYYAESLKCSFFSKSQKTIVSANTFTVLHRLPGRLLLEISCAEQDMVKNLKNVAIPGTGIPLSWHCFFKATVYILILFLNPAMCLLSAINMQRKHGRYGLV